MTGAILYQKKLNTRKIIVLACVGILVVSAVFFLIMPLVNASIYGDFVTAAFAIINQTVIVKSTEVTNILTGAEIWNNASQVSTFIQGLIVVTKSIAASLFMVRLMIEVIHEFSNGEVGLDPFLRLMIKTALTLTLITEIDTVIVGITQWMYDPATGHGVLMDVREAINIEGMRRELLTSIWGIRNSVADSNLLDTFSFVTMLMNLLIVKLLGGLGTIFLFVMIQISSYTLAIEFIIRRIFMPIALVSLMEDGVRGPGMKYIKRMLALFIRMMIMIIAFGAADVMTFQVMQNTVDNLNNGERVATVVWDLFWEMTKHSFVFTIAAYSFSRRGGNLADEIVGI